MEWDTVIGLEVHAQLKTQSKLFSGAATAYGAAPNTQACFIDVGLPGTLPVLNQEVVTMAIQFGLAIDAEVHDLSVFERKNYFYPDLPKGYQISQFQKPLVSNGKLNITLPQGDTKEVSIVRAHLEEDAGKSIHDSYTKIDLNRAGTPLLEIVTAPCLYSAEETVAYLKTLHQLVRFLGICDGSMQEGSFRCDVNLSLKPRGSSTLGTRTELKNLNSFKFIEQAIAYERYRHQDLLEQGQPVRQETRLYNPDTQATYLMRVKEDEQDYRYFPDPDLLPIHLTQEHILSVKAQLPDLPAHIEAHLKTLSSLTEEDRYFLLSSPEIYYFYKDIKAQLQHAPDKLIVNWLKGLYAASLKEQQLSFETRPISALLMAELLDRVHQNKLSNQHAKMIFTHLWKGETDIDAIVQRDGLNQETDDTELLGFIDQLIAQHPQQVSEYQAGKEKLLGFFLGLIMKHTQGRINPEHATTLFKKRVGL